MKRCSKCNSTYTDPELVYCLADGSQLIDISQVPSTVEIPSGNISEPTIIRQPKEKHGAMKWMIAGLILGAFSVLVVGSIAMIFYFASLVQNPPPSEKTPTPKPSPAIAAATTPKESPQPTVEKTPIVKEGPVDGSYKLPLGRVNAPGDGFLALRSEPSDTEGERVERIPHGSFVEIQDCQKDQKTVSGKKGRWCMVSYQERTGWVFDAFLIRDR